MPRDKNIFTLNPTSLDMKRSVFPRNSQHKTSFNMGSLVPIYVDEVLPGDTISLDLANVIRMSTPIAPIMDNIFCDVYFFFIPNRLVWEHWQQFCGENDTTAWTQTTAYQIPVHNIGNGYYPCTVDSIGAYMGLPVGDSYVASGMGNLPTSLEVSELPLRAYIKVWNDWFRSEAVDAPVLYSIGDNSNTSIRYSQPLRKAAKFHDLFTSCLPAPQKGGSVSLPLGQSASIKAAASVHDMGYPVLFDSAVSTSPGAGYYKDLVLEGAYGTLNNKSPNISKGSDTFNPITQSNLYADLSTATAATINQLRYAFQVQKLLEKDARGGRYISLLLKKIAEKIWKVLVRIIRGEGIYQPQRIESEIISPRGRDTYIVKRYAELYSNV